MTIIKIKEMLETLLQYEDSEITHTICSEDNTFSLSYSKELRNFQVENVETGYIEHFPDVETTSIALYRIISTVEKEVTE
ncbi:hypothetical protein Q8G31_25090 [Priestia megaterium]|jgi:hypothetical protein|uniref:hypothetical protein n=1 Tax=Priestia TaxID=2800373 RepID=UPI001A9434A5|nr:hypothetical protein [Priestia megaterium]MBU8590109.1 hypothetical protein [Priestia megaterium]MCT9855725.1 hypothetical protein [Priestia megaterium]MDF1961000.1 hypothetical protein [Priestia megaterium]MDF2012282.1 hypothetical protein [Priestia megaterium]MDF2053541.1 hypothetical protein [Priestia megaterium]